MSRGRYVVIEGNDGTGKSTQVELLSEYLQSQGIETFVVHEPAGTPIADELRTIIKNGELERTPETNLLLFTASRHEIWQQAQAKLAEGCWVISARNYLSTIVFQGYAEGVDIELIKNTTRQFTDETYMNPDYTFILELPQDERNKRIAERGALNTKDTFESRDDEFQQKLEHGYSTIAIENKFPLLDASQSIEAIQETIRSVLATK